ncbi:hypothetical protein [Streptomyces sp. NA02536]|uniref:hypothetical protein n=1 Tax=Streptomyces TaxID=1883 RepID=UPI001590A786|nr:hypothetical protein [Streptomyces sp. NA02536]QKW03453.1 hypothetical protein HUT14_28075 [Streptomyces sp. NA02536]
MPDGTREELGRSHAQPQRRTGHRPTLVGPPRDRTEDTAVPRLPAAGKAEPGAPYP